MVPCLPLVLLLAFALPVLTRLFVRASRAIRDRLTTCPLAQLFHTPDRRDGKGNSHQTLIQSPARNRAKVTDEINVTPCQTFSAPDAISDGFRWDVAGPVLWSIPGSGLRRAMRARDCSRVRAAVISA